jgi:cephalosporin hydroxylase
MDRYTYFLTHTDRTIVKNAHYFPIYERYFRRFVGHPITMCEIGTGDGGSCRMWKHYFGPIARIVTIDINDLRHFEEPQIFARTGEQSDPEFPNELPQEFWPPDIVLDDGSHMMEHINAGFDVLFPRISVAGTYLVEDLDGAYWPSRGGGLGSPGSIIERCKTLIDEMNAVYTGAISLRAPSGNMSSA